MPTPDRLVRVNCEGHAAHGEVAWLYPVEYSLVRVVDSGQQWVCQTDTLQPVSVPSAVPPTAWQLGDQAAEAAASDASSSEYEYYYDESAEEEEPKAANSSSVVMVEKQNNKNENKKDEEKATRAASSAPHGDDKKEGKKIAEASVVLLTLQSLVA